MSCARPFSGRGLSLPRAPSRAPSPFAAVLDWLLCVLGAAFFLFAGYLKLAGDPRLVVEFAMLGMGQGLRYIIGGIEVTGGMFLLVPSRSWIGAVLLLGVDLGAFVAQLGVLHQDWIHTVAIAALLGAIIGLERDRLPRLAVRG